MKASNIQNRFMLLCLHFEVIVKVSQCLACAWTPGTDF